MPKILKVMRGLPASGKTTFAKRWLAESPTERARVSRDDLRFMLFAKPDYSGKQETLVTRIERFAVAEALKDYNVVVDATHIRPKYVSEWWKLAKRVGAVFDIEQMPVDLVECLKRDKQREAKVGDEVIWRMYNQLRKGKFVPVTEPQEQQPSIEPYVPDLMKPRAVIVDIDGTVALNTGGRSPYDMTRVLEDEPNPNVMKVIQYLAGLGIDVVFCSGRNECARADTEQWLRKHFSYAWHGPLFMRPDDDGRKDSVVKLEIFDEHIRDNYNVVAVFDDRNQVVDMWRSLGLTCLQVAPGDF